jgi:hypothetical protein
MPAKRYVLVLDPLEAVFFGLLIVEVYIHELLANLDTDLEGFSFQQERDMWQVTFQVLFIPLSIVWVMQYAVDIVEDVPFGDLWTVFILELFESPVSDVFAAIGAIFGVGVKRESL